jgi:hypothetical protein
MSKIDHSSNLPATIPSSESEAAYEQAQRLLQDRNEGYVPYDRIFTNLKQIKTAFRKIIVGEHFLFRGHEFYWKRPAGEPLALYARNQEIEGLKKRGLVQICRIRVPETWIGVGRFQIGWPERKNDDGETSLLIALYLHSTDTGDFDRMVSGEKANAAFMASLFFDQENADLFYEQAEERFDSLQ